MEGENKWSWKKGWRYFGDCMLEVLKVSGDRGIPRLRPHGRESVYIINVAHTFHVVEDLRSYWSANPFLLRRTFSFFFLVPMKERTPYSMTNLQCKWGIEQNIPSHAKTTFDTQAPNPRL
jgi:hypothetical protein